jgi:hypothetical protein
LPLKSIASAGFQPAKLGSNGKHANHYTTEVTCGRQAVSRSASQSVVKITGMWYQN